MSRLPVARRAIATFLVLAGALPVLSGCAAGRRGVPVAPGGLRLSELDGVGDPRRRASMELVLQGLDADESGQGRRAVGLYEQAVRLDAANPFAYLALARHFTARDDVSRTLEYLGQAEVLLESEGSYDARVEAHVYGLRGAALVAAGRAEEGRELLGRARELAPDVWEDAQLTAGELR